LTYKDYFAAVDEGRLVTLKQLISDESQFDRRGEGGAMVYANTWALMHFLQRANRKELGAYLQDVSQRKPRVDVTPEQELALFEKYFGEIDYIFQRRFATFILGLDPPSPSIAR
jgi:hypothetical protein